jgi:hypothetical protein
MTPAALSSAPAGRRARARELGLLLLVCLALRVVGLWRPCLSDDEATYCVVGREMLSGHVLYRDVVDHKPPLIYVTYAATQAIGGPVGGMRLVHLATALVVLATALVLGRIARLLGGARPEAAADRDGFAAALLYVVFSTTLLDFDALAANCELFMMLPLAGSVAIYLRAARRGFPPGALASVGGLVAVAALYKYQAAIQLPLYAAHLALSAGRRQPARVLAGWGALAAGALAIVAAAGAVIFRADALGAAWFWFRFNFAYMGEGLRPGEVAARAAPRIAYGVLPALFLWVLALRGARERIDRARAAGAPADPVRPELFAVGWLFASVLAVTAGGRFFGHYFHQLTAPLAVLAASGARRLWASRRRTVLAAVGAPAAAFFLLGLGHGRVMAAAGAPEPDYAAIAAFVGAHSAPGDRLAVWGNAPVLYFAAGRPLGSRFVFSNYLTGLSPATRTQTDPGADASANVVGGSWEMFEADLAARRPRLFVDTSPGNIGAYGKFPPARFPRLRAILERDYTPIGEVAGARILALRTR